MWIECTQLNDAFETLTVRKSKWTLLESQFASIDFFIKKCRHGVHKLNFNCNTKLSNVSKEEWAALINLKNCNDLVIKAADKGGATVVWRTDLYKSKSATFRPDILQSQQRPNFTSLFVFVFLFFFVFCSSFCACVFYY